LLSVSAIYIHWNRVGEPLVQPTPPSS
jgi:hypothetical protein